MQIHQDSYRIIFKTLLSVAFIMDGDKTKCPLVKTTCGLLKGIASKAVDPSAKVVYNFLGVPFGKSPVNERRFVAPQKADPWEGVLKADHTFNNSPQDVSVSHVFDGMIPYKNPLCHDAGIVKEEASLQLNVFTPECSQTSEMPVMVWLQGGHYQRHCGGRVDGNPLAGMNDVVIVVPNFRVNAFGFLSLGKGSCCPGNVALLDVILALEWIRDNIQAFGGDTQNVTLFGESSGSGMVHLLMMSPLSRGLFNKAILVSGAVTTPFLFADDLTTARDRFLKRLDLDANTMEDTKILEKLQNLSIDQIMDAQKDFDDFVNFLPCIDGHVITDSPLNLIQSGQVHPVSLLVGCTNSEGAGMLSMVHFPNFEKGVSEDLVKANFKATFNAVYKAGSAEAGYEMVKKFYLNDKEEKEDPLKYSLLHGEIFSDSVFIVPTIVAATAHAAVGHPTYLFQMTQKSDFSHSAENGPGVRKKPHFTECDHGDDLYYSWGVPFSEGALTGGAYFTEDEIELSRVVMRYFTNFARTGDPNKTAEVKVTWPAYTCGTSRQHIILQVPLKTGTNLGLDEVLFYTEKLPRAGLI